VAKNKKKKTFRAFYRIVNAFAAKIRIAAEFTSELLKRGKNSKIGG